MSLLVRGWWGSKARETMSLYIFLDAIASQEILYIQVTYLLTYLLTYSLSHRVEVTFQVRYPGLSDIQD